MRFRIIATVVAALALQAVFALAAKAEPSRQEESIKEYSQAILDVVSQARATATKIERASQSLTRNAKAAEEYSAQRSFAAAKEAADAAKRDKASLNLALADLSSYRNTTSVMIECIGILGGSLSPQIQTGLNDLGKIILSSQQTYRVSLDLYEGRVVTISLSN